MTTLRSQEMMMECSVCTAREMIALPESYRDTLRAKNGLSRHCKSCLQNTLWQIASHTISTASGLTHSSPSIGRGAMPRETNSQKKESRKQRRCKIRMTACIRHAGSEEVETVLDASRYGIRFQSSNHYSCTWVQVAVPYTGGSSDIFVSGRIVWRKRLTARLQDYGLRYDQ